MNNSLELKGIISIYYSSRGGYSRPDDIYLQKHPVCMKDGKPLLLEGNPLTREALTELCRAVLPSIMCDTLTFLNGRVLSSAGTVAGPDIWWVEPKKRPIYFSKELKIQNSVVHWPGLVFVANKGTLSVFAVKGKKRPDPATKLYLAPFLNTNHNSRVCLGNTPVPSKNSDYEAWEAAFFKSRFTEVHDHARVKGGNLVEFWKERTVNPGVSFPESLLLPATPSTLAKLLADLKKRENEDE